MIRSEDFFNNIIILFPDIEEDLNIHKRYYGELLDTIFLEDILMPKIFDLIKRDESELLMKFFKYLEKVFFVGDESLVNNLEVTILEMLGNDRSTLLKTQKYMGEKTKELQKQADIALGRTVE